MVRHILDFVKENKYVIISSIIIFVAHFIIISHVGMHGWDDYVSSTYYNAPNMTLEEKLDQVVGRAQGWNCRFGEIIYFVMGAFPSIIFWIIDSVFMILLSSLVVYFALGIERYSQGKLQVAFLSLLTYVFFVTIYPGIGSTFLWKGAAYNHVFSIILLFFVLLPFRNDSYNSKIKRKFDIKYALYLILCFISAYGSEGAVISCIMAMFVHNIVILLKNKRINLFYFLPLIIMSIGFVLFLRGNSLRVNRYLDLDSTKEAINEFTKVFFKNRIAIFLVFIIANVAYIIRFKFTKELLKRYLWLIYPAFSVIIIVAFAYYTERAIVNLSLCMNIIIVFCLYELIKDINKKHILIFSVIPIIYLTVLTKKYCYLLNDYNSYEALRKEYIRSQLQNDIIYVPCYDRAADTKMIYNYYESVLSSFNGEDGGWLQGLKWLYEIPDYKEIVVFWEVDKCPKLR